MIYDAEKMAELARECTADFRAQRAITALIARAQRDAIEAAALRIHELHAEPHCVNGHDRCYEGPSDACPYCEKHSDIEDAIRALLPGDGA